jgi:hypothetical protein
MIGGTILRPAIFWCCALLDRRAYVSRTPGDVARSLADRPTDAGAAEECA